ncbi:MAG: HRDC domain-containing protein, partial [Planctomycetes bacterium]|nr:HRDC domain-containing protein [Planctomycetota bacterium]
FSVSDPDDLDDASLLLVTLTGVDLFVGVGGSLDDKGTPEIFSDDGISTSDAIGFVVADAGLELAIIKPGLAAIQAGDTRSFTGLEVTIGQAALVGLEYPAAYGTLVDRLLGCSLPKGETRTDWRRRPLSHRQLEYAVKDVEFLGPLWQELSKRLKNLGRRDWLDTEMTAWQQQIEHDTSEARWRRVSGSAGLNTRQLAIVRELWKWRDNEAERRDRPARRVLRDDLIVELARRGTADEGRISAVRGLNRRDVQKHVSNLSTCIHAALELPEEELPERHRRAASSSQLNLLSQFLSTALASICRAAQVAPSLVGTVQDVRDLVAFRLKPDRASMSPPALATGWRAEIVGQTIDDLLAGKLSIRITDPLSDHPLEFESND